MNGMRDVTVWGIKLLTFLVFPEFKSLCQKVSSFFLRTLFRNVIAVTSISCCSWFHLLFRRRTCYDDVKEHCSSGPEREREKPAHRPSLLTSHLISSLQITCLFTLQLLKILPFFTRSQDALESVFTHEDDDAQTTYTQHHTQELKTAGAQ
jgi:hypothetical protein